MNDVDLPLLAGAIHSNEITISSVVDRVVSARALNVALLGLSFKMQTDDLRESPYVTLAETLIGKGFNVRIHDPIVNPSRLVGTNSAYINAKLPHLRRLLAASAAEAISGADVAIVSSSDPAVADALVAEPSAAVARPQRSPGTRRRGAAGLCRLRVVRSLSVSNSNREQPPARPHHRAELARSVRPASVARVPGAA